MSSDGQTHSAQQEARPPCLVTDHSSGAMTWTGFLLIYFLGGLTFFPFIVAIVFAHAYFTLPIRRDVVGTNANTRHDDLVQPGDDVGDWKEAAARTRVDEVKVRPKTSLSDLEVAAGYFAVCREYTPMGINAKPIERSTPVGSATVAAPSPSVYQTMYRSIFDRKQATGPLDNNKNTSQRPKRAGNVFYVVLRHGHLMLFDDDEQLEVRHVVSLAHHKVSIYSDSEPIPEGELFIKRNAICLSRKDSLEGQAGARLSKPFFLFSENCSAKEDFYFALLRNQELHAECDLKGPTPLTFDVKNIISLVQKLHSSEEHMQTRWLNALIGRVFLGVYKTSDIENYIREKLTKKISRVKRPSFLSNIAINGISTGESAPYITNPRLRDLTVEGECGVETDVRYTGSFRLEVAATARIDLGTRFKAREVNLVLAVVVRKLEGKVLFKIKAPPSNRLWFSFQQMPKMEMTIEPIVSSRQITYTVILRQIENRIKEVIAETLVLPFWDDMPFFSTEHKQWRGGIFDDDRVRMSPKLHEVVAQFGDVEDLERIEESSQMEATESELPPMEKRNSMPVVDSTSSTGLFGRKTSVKSNGSGLPTATNTLAASASSTGLELKSNSDSGINSSNDTPSPLTTPRSARSASFMVPPLPTVGTDATHADIFVPSSSSPNESPAVAAMANLSAKSQSSTSASQTPQMLVAAPFRPYITSKSSSNSCSSHEGTDTEKDVGSAPERQITSWSTVSVGEGNDTGNKEQVHQSRSPVGSIRSQTSSITRDLSGRKNMTGISLQGTSGTNSTSHTSVSISSGFAEGQKRTALAAVASAAASAKKWGLHALQRRQEGRPVFGTGPGTNKNGFHPHSTDEEESEVPALDLNQPMGRGRPLPPPGQPLPMPDRRSKTAPIPVPRRRPTAPPAHPHPPAPSFPQRHSTGEAGHGQDAMPSLPSPSLQMAGHKTDRRPVPPPPLPKRRLQAEQGHHNRDDGRILVVAAPAESEPTSPLSASHSPSQARVGHSWAALDGEGSRESVRHVNVKDANDDDDDDDDDDDEYSAWMDNSGLEELEKDEPVQ